MPRFLSRQNVVLTDEQHYSTKQNQIQVNQDAERNTKIDTTNTKLDDLKNQQDGVIGAINNTTIGDATLGQRTYVYAHDVANGQARALKCDASGRLECSVDALEVTAETINLNTDTLESLIGTTNTKLQSDLDFAGQPNSIGDGSNMKRVMNYGHDSAGGAQRPLKVDADGHLQVDILSTTAASGSATEAKQDTQITHLSEIEGAVENVELTVGTNTATAPTRSLQIGGKYVDGTFRDIKVDNIGKVIVDSPSGSDINTRIDAIANAQTQNGDGTGNKPGVMLDAINTNTITQNSKIDGTNAALNVINNNALATVTAVNLNTDAQTQNGDGTGNKPGVMLDAINTNTITQNSKIDTTNSHLSTLAGAVSGSEVQVDVVSMPTTTVSDGGGSLTVDNSVLTSLNSAINSNRVDVNIANGGFDGAVTNSALTELAAAINSNRVDVNIANGGFDGAVTNAALTELAAAINSSRVDVNIANGGFDGAVTNAGTFAVQVDGDALTSLQLIDDIVKSEDAAHSGGDKGVQILSVRKDTATNLGGSDADYQPLITDANGRLHGINRTAVENSSETSYISSQSISGSGTFEGSAIAVDPNTKAFYAEHNFSHTGIKYEILGSIDGTNFFSTGVEFNAGGMSPATLTGLSTIKGTASGSEGFPPHIKFKFSNSDSSVQAATLSYVQQIG